METKKSKVIQVDQNIGTFTTDNGTFYKHMIYFENEDKGIYNSKDSVCKKFTKDHEVDYTIEPGPTGYPDKIKPAQKEWTGGGKPQKKDYVSYGTSYVKDLIVDDKLKIDQWEIAARKIVLFMVALDKELNG